MWTQENFYTTFFALAPVLDSYTNNMYILFQFENKQFTLLTGRHVLNESIHNFQCVYHCQLPNLLYNSVSRHDYERVLRCDPMNLPARVNLAYTLQVSGHFMQAWRQFTCALDIRPSRTQQ